MDFVSRQDRLTISNSLVKDFFEVSVLRVCFKVSFKFPKSFDGTNNLWCLSKAIGYGIEDNIKRRDTDNTRTNVNRALVFRVDLSVMDHLSESVAVLDVVVDKVRDSLLKVRLTQLVI